MNFLKLKPLTAELIPAAVELDRRALGGLWSQSGYEKELDSPNSELLVLTPEPAEADKQTLLTSLPPHHSSLPIVGLGCLWAIVEEAHITVLAIDPSYQRQGLGQALLWALLTAARQRGLEWATLEVRVSNQSALSLYHKFGFQEVGQRRRYYQDTGENAVILWLQGLQKPEFQQRLQDWQQQVGDRLYKFGWAWAADD